MTAKDNVKLEWSGINVAEFGPYRESVHAALGARLFRNPELRGRLAADTSLYKLETGFHVSDDTTIIDKADNEFIFVVPKIPPQDEIWYRYEQISGWWMLAHAFYWWMGRHHGSQVDSFLPALDVQIIGRSWQDMEWRQHLVTDPRAALESEIGGTFAPDLKVKAIEETRGHILVLPTSPERESVENGIQEHVGNLFASAHTWWQWLVWPRLMRPVGASQISEMVR